MDIGCLDSKTVAEEFSRLRRFHGLSQEEAAQALGVSVGTVHNFEAFKGVPKSDTLLLFARKVELWRGEMGVSSAARESLEFYRVGDLKRDFRCGSCGAMTPSPDGNESNPLFCCFCGAQVARKCPKCSTFETRSDAKFCRVCMFPINQAGLSELGERQRSLVSKKRRK